MQEKIKKINPKIKICLIIFFFFFVVVMNKNSCFLFSCFIYFDFILIDLFSFFFFFFFFNNLCFIYTLDSELPVLLPPPRTIILDQPKFQPLSTLILFIFNFIFIIIIFKVLFLILLSSSSTTNISITSVNILLKLGWQELFIKLCLDFYTGITLHEILAFTKWLPT